MTPTRWYAPVMNNLRGKPWSRRGSFIAGVVLAFFAVTNAALRLTDEDAGPVDTTAGLLLASWFGVLAWLFLAHATLNASTGAEKSERGS